MATAFSDIEIQEALQDCADEQVHIPGVVQPYACLVAIEAKTHVVRYASANTAQILGAAPTDLLGHPLDDTLPREAWHALQNVLTLRSADRRTNALGEHSINGAACAVFASLSAGLVVLEIEPAQDPLPSNAPALQTLDYLTEEIQSCETEDALYKATTELLKHLTGYDRVMIYRFDPQWNGEVLAETKRADLESFNGLRFPHWDIPKQARVMMLKFPIRFIADVDQVPVPLVPGHRGAPPLDISLAYCRGVSMVHMEYLRSVGVSATMTLTVTVENTLWGIISFHSMVPKVPPPGLRQLLISVGRAFNTKLQVLLQKSRLKLVTRVDDLKEQLIDDMDDDAGFETFAASVLSLLDGTGLVLMQDGLERHLGRIPDAPLIDELVEVAHTSTKVRSFESLSETFPNHQNALNGCAGAILFAPVQDRIFIVFREEQAQEISWAGNPEKTIEDHDGRRRLSPRGSFSLYLDTARGRSKPWSEQDLYFSSRIWSLVNSVERRVMMTSLNRQQQIMINELNHRVRNILALIRSVSQQARHSSDGSLESYSRSLESRIQALAASHNLASGSVVATVPVVKLITTEFEPFGLTDSDRYTLTPIEGALRAEVAPIFSLVIHELVTNAVKYGALSNDTGTVELALSKRDEGLDLQWIERGGPPVTEPAELGFGYTLITQAIPHELDGEASLAFHPDGVHARLFLPAAHFDTNRPVGDTSQSDAHLPEPVNLPLDLSARNCLIVEDNFVIARGMREQIIGMGLGGAAELAASVEDALAVVDSGRIDFAILDVNLGAGTTSEPIADRLVEKGIPFLFVTGYGDSNSIPGGYADHARLKKPVMDGELRETLAQILSVRAAAE